MKPISVSSSVKITKDQIMSCKRLSNKKTLDDITIDMPVDQIINVIVKEECDRQNVKEIDSTETFFKLVPPELI